MQDLILSQLKELSTAAGKQGQKLASIATVQQAQTMRLQSLEKVARDTWEAEISCPARGAHEKVLKRISNIEARHTLKQTGNFDVGDTTSTHKLPIQVQPTADGHGFKVTGPLIVKYLPWILLASMGLLQAAQSGFFELWAK